MSRRSKRTSLESILVDGAQATPVTTPEPASAPKARTLPERKPIKQQTVYLPIPVYEQLRRLAFDEREKMHTLIMEGLDRVFQDRGLQSLAELEAKS